ncbi:MAG: hypothetical protein AAGK17_13340 [Pseudomonadota bacterium]
MSIGTYETQEEALSVVEMLGTKPGFRDFPEGFQIEETRLGITGWADGFVSVVGPPPKDANGEVFDLPADPED